MKLVITIEKYDGVFILKSVFMWSHGRVQFAAGECVTI